VHIVYDFINELNDSFFLRFKLCVFEGCFKRNDNYYTIKIILNYTVDLFDAKLHINMII